MKLYLVDSSIFIFKAWFSTRIALFNRDQQSNHAFIGFTDFVYRLLTEIAPSKLVFAFDQSQQHSERKAIYADYKANRNPAPIELKRQFGWCREWLNHLGISNIADNHWEADDLIGSLAKLHRSAELPVVILSADKDLTQLVHEGDLWWPFYDTKAMDYRAICKKYRVRPDQIADQLALTGDKVDNIPGIPFVGPKTAAGLLRKFDNLATLRDNLDQVGKMKFRYAARVQQSLIDNQSILDTSSRLTVINCDIGSVKNLSIQRAAIQVEKLRGMMEIQAMDAQRREKWEAYLTRAQNTEHD